MILAPTEGKWNVDPTSNLVLDMLVCITPKKRKDVPTDSPVIRKVPRLSLQKASLEVEALVATQMEEDIDNLLLESDTD